MAEPAQRGDSDDLTAIYREHVWDVYGFFSYRLGNVAQAEDLTQATFERATKAFRRYDRSRARPKTWLLSIARNLLIDHYRADRSALHARSGEDGVELNELPDPAAPAPGGPAPGAPLSAELAGALSRLRARDREVLALRYGSDMTGPEIAELLSISLANVQQTISRSLRKLRAELQSAEKTRAGLHLDV